MRTTHPVPNNFLRLSSHASVPGVHPKRHLPADARGDYVASPCADYSRERCGAYQDLVEHLVAHCRSEQAEPQALDSSALRTGVESRLKSNDCAFSYKELVWVMQPVAHELGAVAWSEARDVSLTPQDAETLIKLSQVPGVSTRVQAALDALRSRARTRRPAGVV